MTELKRNLTKIMRLHNFDNTQCIDILELFMYDYRKLSESDTPLCENYDLDRYKNFIEEEKNHSVKYSTMVIGNLYAPISLFAIPAGIRIRTTNEDITFQSLNQQILFTKSNKQLIAFPPNNLSFSDSSVDTIIFNNQTDKNEFLSVLKLKFNGWHFSISTL